MNLEKKYHKCSICPGNMECLGGNIIIPFPGFFRKDNNSKNVVPCIVNEACLGITNYKNNNSLNLNSICREGNTGNLCNYCEKFYGRYEKSDYCRNCTSFTLLIYIRIAFYIFFIVI